MIPTKTLLGHIENIPIQEGLEGHTTRNSLNTIQTTDGNTSGRASGSELECDVSRQVKKNVSRVFQDDNVGSSAQVLPMLDLKMCTSSGELDPYYWNMILLMVLWLSRTFVIGKPAFVMPRD